MQRSFLDGGRRSAMTRTPLTLHSHPYAMKRTTGTVTLSSFNLGRSGGPMRCAGVQIQVCLQ